MIAQPRRGRNVMGRLKLSPNQSRDCPRCSGLRKESSKSCPLADRSAAGIRDLQARRDMIAHARVCFRHALRAAVNVAGTCRSYTAQVNA